MENTVMVDSRFEENPLKNANFERIVIVIEVDKLENIYRRTAGSKIFSEYLHCFSNTSCDEIIKIPPVKIGIM